MSFNDNKHNNLQRYADNQHTENNYSVVSQKLLALVLICLVSCKSVNACKKALGDQLVGRKITKNFSIISANAFFQKSLYAWAVLPNTDQILLISSCNSGGQFQCVSAILSIKSTPPPH